MEEFDFLRHVTIGQYLPGDSPIHRLDPRAKMTAALFLTIAVTFCASYTGHLLLLAAILGLVIMARLSVRYLLAGLRPALPFIVFLAVMQLFFYGSAAAAAGGTNVVLWQWGWLHLTTGSLRLTVVSLARLVELIFVVSLVTNTTPLTRLTYGIEGLLRPFTPLGLPAHELALIGTIALRFVPVLGEQLESILKAQASRGADLKLGGQLRLIQNTRQVLVLLVPLFLSTLGRSEDLTLAMEARCYGGGKGRSHLVHLQMRGMDYAALALSAAFMVGIVVLRGALP